MKLTPLGKVIIVLALLVTAFFSVKRFAPGLLDKIVPAAKTREAVVPGKAASIAGTASPSAAPSPP